MPIILWYRWIKLSTMIIHIIWHKEVHLIVNLFVWRLLHNHIATIDNLIKRMMLRSNTHLCSSGCDLQEDIDHLYFIFFCRKKNARVFQQTRDSIQHIFLRKLRSDLFSGWRKIIIILLLTIICDDLSLFCVWELLLLPPSYNNLVICQKILSHKNWLIYFSI